MLAPERFQASHSRFAYPFAAVSLLPPSFGFGVVLLFVSPVWLSIGRVTGGPRV